MSADLQGPVSEWLLLGKVLDLPSDLHNKVTIVQCSPNQKYICQVSCSVVS